MNFVKKVLINTWKAILFAKDFVLDVYTEIIVNINRRIAGEEND